jgi:hypothetical protein
LPKVFIGVGHGGSTIKGGDPGAVSGKYIEADINLVMGLAAKKALEAHGVTVCISREADKIVGLAKEVELCNAFMPDLAIECHNNAGGGQGFEVYRQQSSRHAAQSLKLAQLVEKHVLADIDTKSRGIKGEISPAGGYIFGWLKCNCPSVLCEGEFVDSAAGQARLATEAKQRAYGVAYAKGVLELLGITYKLPGGTTAATTVSVYVRNADGKQIGAYSGLTQAVKDLVDKNPGYKAFDKDGSVVYDPIPVQAADPGNEQLRGENFELQRLNADLQKTIDEQAARIVELNALVAKQQTTISQVQKLTASL